MLFVCAQIVWIHGNDDDDRANDYDDDANNEDIANDDDAK